VSFARFHYIPKPTAFYRNGSGGTRTVTGSRHFRLKLLLQPRAKFPLGLSLVRRKTPSTALLCQPPTAFAGPRTDEPGSTDAFRQPANSPTRAAGLTRCIYLEDNSLPLGRTEGAAAFNRLLKNSILGAL
jgi:hypothetical protein